MTAPRLHPLLPGAVLPGDWFQGRIPENISVGDNCVIDSSFCFKHFYAIAPVGLRMGKNVTVWRTTIATEEGGVIEIGDDCYLANASLVCSRHVRLGARVMISGGVTIADSDFHPIAPAARLADTVALSPVGDRHRRPPVEARPVDVGDDVWIGFNATILKGVQIGAGATVAPGSLVLDDVGAGQHVAGNPARAVTG